MTLNVILKVIAILIIVKCLILIIIPSQIRRLTLKLARTPKTLRKTALLYLIFGVILLLVSILL